MTPGSISMPLDLTGANLKDAGLSELYLDGANLAGANLAGASLDQSVLQAANLRGANLARASLWETDLQAANLEGANLAFADLEGVVLDFANFADADLRGAPGIRHPQTREEPRPRPIHQRATSGTGAEIHRRAVGVPRLAAPGRVGAVQSVAEETGGTSPKNWRAPPAKACAARAARPVGRNDDWLSHPTRTPSSLR